MPATETDDKPATRRPRRATGSKGTRLVIVESPYKARRIAEFLGSGYVVEASAGHIRDLPRSAADVPAKYKGESWARLGVDVDHGFTPLYVITPDRKDQVSKLKALIKDASELLLATDEDREGEAIAWHLVQTLNPTVPIRRMVFHEITRSAIEAAVADPRELDENLVQAQETRRILDRLYGYEVSPVLWKKVMPKLSAGRVQSVATRIIVERERARIAFRTADYWDLDGVFDTNAPSKSDPTAPTTFTARLVSLDGDKVATGRDFDPATGQASSQVVHLDETGARGLAARLTDTTYAVARVETKPYRRRPYPPFMTSTLQQEAGRKLHYSSEQTMRIAQRLYENGYITYMRTDSTSLSETALSASRRQAAELYGNEYVPAEPRRYVRKVKNAQEAHEAIRPAGDDFRTPGEAASQLSRDEFRLYELVWKRTIASQMADAVGESVSLRLTGRSATDEQVEFAASGKTISFPGFLRAYVEGADDPDAELEDSERRLPQVEKGQALTVNGLDARGHSTSPPARFTEASLVKEMEELGIGRPSTYSAIIRTIQDRGYVWKKGSALIPAWVAFSVTGLLEQYFGRLVDYNFTASVEGDLDRIAGGEEHSVDWLSRFYFGTDASSGAGAVDSSMSDAGGLRALVSDRLGEIDARSVNSLPLPGTPVGTAPEIVVRVGRYGPYLQRMGADGELTGEGDRASVPDDLPPDELTREKAEELLSAPSGDRELGTDPESELDVVAKTGRYGPYVVCGEKTASLFASMSLDDVTLADALRLLTLPREVGAGADGEMITALNGRYGPYIKKGTDSRSLENEEQLFTVDLEQANAIFSQPKQRGRRAAAAPLRELGKDSATDAPMVIKDGRFGPYVTDGETNASLRKGDDVESITDERAAELLADRRARGPAKPKKKAAKKTVKKAVKKTTAKKVTAKKSTKKTATKVAAKKNATS